MLNGEVADPKSKGPVNKWFPKVQFISNKILLSKKKININKNVTLNIT